MIIGPPRLSSSASLVVIFNVVAGVAELVDAADSKSAGVLPHAGSSPALGTLSIGRSLTHSGVRLF